jgi:hypothetical protein
MESVIAKRVIHQCPLSLSPDVPRGTRGTLEDQDGCSGDVFVDFGQPFGVVLCDPTEIRRG